MRYPISDLVENLENRFTYHPPNVETGQAERYTHIRQQALDLAKMIASMTPPSREQSLALTKLEECVLWANAAIARHEDAGEAEVE